MRGSWIALTAAALAMAAAPAAARADWSGDSKGDVLAVAQDGRLLLYRGTGTGGFATASGEPIGSGWSGFTAVFSPGDFSGDGRADLLARQLDGTLLLYRGDGAGGFVAGTGEPIGSGWQVFTALLGPGDWTGDGKADLLARTRDGALLLYRGNGAGGFLTGRAEQVGGGGRRSRRRPYVVRLRMNRPAGSRGRVYARAVFQRKGSAKLRRKTVSRRFVMWP